MYSNYPVLVAFALLSTACAHSQSSPETPLQDSILDTVSWVEEEWQEPEFDFSLYDLRTVPDSSIGYTAQLLELKQQRETLLQSGASGDSLYAMAGKLFTESLLNQVIPWWYGTEWDFNGYTDTPGEGVIACGYFVSTTLKHAGIPINRYRMAQQHGTNEALTLQDKAQLRNYHSEQWDAQSEITDSLAQLPEGLYFVGLDNHVGYLLHRKGQLFFLHSSYTDPVAVVIEPLERSQAFWMSANWILADISHNSELMRKWLEQEKVRVRTN